MRTFSPKDSDITRQWHVVDASDVVLGRLASHVAVLLRGKHKPIFAPHVDTGDFVIVVNAAKVALSGNKLEQKHAYRHSGYPGGLRAVSYASLMESNPERAVEKAVRGMLPKNYSAARRCASSRCTRVPITRTRLSSRSRTRSRRSSSRPKAEEVRGPDRGRAHWRNHHPGVEDDAEFADYPDEDRVDVPSEYTTETSQDAPARAVARRPVVTGNAAGTGRRKEAIARLRILPGSGQWLIKGRTLDVYFPNKVHQQLVSEPFVTLGGEGQFDVVARISGGGVTGQAGALRLGVTRALILVDPENRPALKKAGFVTRDARVKERKKYGLKKARKAPQYSKR